MLKIKVIEKSGAFCEYISEKDLLEKIHLLGHGQPERWVDSNSFEITEDNIIDTRNVIIAPEIPEIINDAGEIVQEFIPAVLKKEVKLKADYTIEITDVTKEFNEITSIIKRRKEYPTPEEFMNAYFDGGEIAVNELQEKRLKIKSKYPKY